MIRSHHRDGLSLLTIDRPDKANALTADMLRDLLAREFPDIGGDRP